MLNKEQLLDISKFTRLKLHQQEKHYIQTLVLSSLYASVSSELVFKGGTALLFFYGLNRFSEDLDFTVVKDVDLKKLCENVEQSLAYVGMPKRIGQKKDTAVSFSFKVGAEGPLYDKEISRCFVDVEISKREIVEHFETKEVRSIYPDILPFTVCVMKQEEIVAEKIRAILKRNYARDVYDLHFLLRRGCIIDSSLVQKKMEFYHEVFKKAEFLKKVDEKKSVWESELKSFVIGELPTFSDVKKVIVDAVEHM